MQSEPSPVASLLAARSSRRALLRFLLGSPLLLAARPASALESLLAAVAEGEAGAAAARPLIRAAAEALDVFDFSAAAERKLSEAHWTFLSMGTGDEFTLRANREAFAGFQLRPRRLVDVRELDMSTQLFGTPLSCPIVLAPVGKQRAFHPEGELAVARAARRKDHLQILSTFSSAPLEEVSAARGAPPWFQLYTPRVWPLTQRQLARAEADGCRAVVLTVDQLGIGTKRSRIQRFQRPDNPECQACHQSRVGSVLRGAVSAARAVGIDTDEIFADLLVLDWDVVDRIRDATPLKFLVKGILTHEDARLCVEHGVDGIVVSNHGGRAEDSGLATIEALPEIAAAVAGRVPILIDSGFRRGSDVFKALALGASAVCVGRPYLWGLAAFGQEGVEAVLELLRRELETIMREMGTPNLAAITPGCVRQARPAGAGPE